MEPTEESVTLHCHAGSSIEIRRTDIDKFVEPAEVPGIPGVERCAVHARRSGDQQVHGPSSWLASETRHRSGELAVAPYDLVIDGKC
jgi:hypothetical protein